MSIVMSNVNARMDLEICQKSLAKQGLVVADHDISQSDLILETQLLPTKSSFEFSVLENVNNAGTTTAITEVRLKPQDAFYMTHLQYSIMLHTIPDVTTPDLYRYMPFLYPSEHLNQSGAIFSKLGYKLWWAQLAITINKEVIIPEWSVIRHMFVPQGQKDTWNGAFPASTFYKDHDEQDGATSGWYPVEPNVVFLGNDGINIDLDFPEDLNNAIAAPGDGYIIKAVLRCRGLLCQNVTKTANRRNVQ